MRDPRDFEYARVICLPTNPIYSLSTQSTGYCRRLLVPNKPQVAHPGGSRPDLARRRLNRGYDVAVRRSSTIPSRRIIDQRPPDPREETTNQRRWYHRLGNWLAKHYVVDERRRGTTVASVWICRW